MFLQGSRQTLILIIQLPFSGEKRLEHTPVPTCSQSVVQLALLAVQSSQCLPKGSFVSALSGLCAGHKG
jgi:hypothetical protein